MGLKELIDAFSFPSFSWNCISFAVEAMLELQNEGRNWGLARDEKA